MSFTPPPPPPMPPGPPVVPDGEPRPGRRTRIGAIAAGAVVLAAVLGTVLYLASGGDGAPAAAPSTSAPPPPSSPLPTPSATPSDTPNLPYLVLKPGTCFDHPNLTKGLKEVTVRPCTVPHDGEAVANVTVKGGFTKDSQIVAAVYKQCAAAGKRTADRQGEGTRFYSYVLTPSAALYRRGYREATCTLTVSYTVGGKKLTGKLH
ncbi:hypothetical protein [Peterkaempfera sp. SMS 1(5)a]|uniref:hypothetical protein n=1 Tax=Peterkaempfera podocarpi TaxID=3232308 RepID=UPI0036725B99